LGVSKLSKYPRNLLAENKDGGGPNEEDLTEKTDFLSISKLFRLIT